MLEEEALDLTHYISHTGQVSLFGCVIEFELFLPLGTQCESTKVARLIVTWVLGQKVGMWAGFTAGFN